MASRCSEPARDELPPPLCLEHHNFWHWLMPLGPCLKNGEFIKAFIELPAAVQVASLEIVSFSGRGAPLHGVGGQSCALPGSLPIPQDIQFVFPTATDPRAELFKGLS